MTISYHLKKTLSSGDFIAQGISQTDTPYAHRIKLPAGYNFGPSIAQIQAVGTGTYIFRGSNYGSPADPLQVSLLAGRANEGFVGSPAGLVIYDPAHNFYVGTSIGNWTENSVVEIQFTASFPVVLV
jgi:hypothetical protein